MNHLVIIGAGGHGKVIAHIAMQCGYGNIAFVDDNVCKECMGFPVIGICNDIMKFDDGKTDFIIAIGNNKIRRMIAERYDVNYVILIHPSAQIGIHVNIAAGTVVMPGAVINPCTMIGVHCIINTAAVVEHDNRLGDYVHISPNATLAGTVWIGNNTHIGIGATVKNNIRICENCIIGAGAVVVKNITRASTYIGIPARCIES